MSISKKSSKINKYQLSGSLKKSGLNSWRFVFNGIDKLTAMERKFFIELSMLNPALSSDEVVLGFKPRINILPEDLQNVLAGTASAKNIQSESYVVPSYVVVRAGILGSGAKQVCTYVPFDKVSVSSKSFYVHSDNFSFNDEKLSGHIEHSPGDIQEHPEYLCDSGNFNWDLRYEIKSDSSEGYDGKNCFWAPTGLLAVFSGNFTVDGKVYDVIPKKSFGYIDRFYGKNVVFPWIHISSSALTSVISGKTLLNSAFAVQGIFDERLSAVINIEGKSVIFDASKGKHSFVSKWNFSQVPENDSEETLHWSLSFHNKSYVVDIDIFCPSAQMYVKSVEIPEGNRKLLKMLCGGTGNGEIKVFKKIKKNLELIEHNRVVHALCEYGQEEEPEK